MVIASEENLGDHETHAHGLAALMKIGDSPLNLLNVRGAVGGSNSNSLRLQVEVSPPKIPKLYAEQWTDMVIRLTAFSLFPP